MRTIPATKLARLLAKACRRTTIAALMNEFLCVEDDERLNEAEVDLGQQFFDMLCDLRPECITLAATGEMEVDETHDEQISIVLAPPTEPDSDEPIQVQELPPG